MRALLLLLLLLSSAAALAAPARADAAPGDSSAIIRMFQVLPGDSGRVDVAAAVLPIPGGAFVAGWTIPAGGQADGLLLRVDDAGRVLWRGTPGGAGNDILFSLAEASEGHYTAVGMAPGPEGGTEGWVVNFERDGQVLATNRLGGTGSVRFTSIAPDGREQLIAGEQARGDTTFAPVHRPSPEPMRMYWRTWSGGASTRGFAAAPAPGGDAIVVGVAAEGADPGDGFVTRLARDGSARWTHRVPGAGRQLAYHLAQRPDSSWLVVGYGDAGGGRGADGYALAIDGAGRVAFTTPLGDSADDRAVHGVTFADGTSAVVGYARAQGGAEDAATWTTVLWGLDAQGRRTWTRALGGPGRDSGRWIAGPANDVWVVGQERAADGGSRVFVARLDLTAR